MGRGASRNITWLSPICGPCWFPRGCGNLIKPCNERQCTWTFVASQLRGNSHRAADAQLDGGYGKQLSAINEWDGLTL